MSSPSFPAAIDLDGSFTPPTHEQWVESALAGLAPDTTLDSLQRRTLDGLAIRVLYEDDANATEQSSRSGPLIEESSTSLPSGTWDNRLCIEDTRDARRANRLIHEGLKSGITSLEIHLDQNAEPGAVLADVLLDVAPLSVRAADRYTGMAPFVLAEVERQALDGASLLCSFNADPVGHCVQSGASLETLDDEFKRMAAFAIDMNQALPKASTVLVDTTLHHNAGASERQELQAAVVTGSLYLQALLDAGMSVQDASRTMVFQIACDADVMMGIVKLRSLRNLWRHILEQAGNGQSNTTSDAAHPGVTTRIVAETSRRYQSRLEPWNNHLRNIAACSAAAMGGATAIIVHPHDSIGMAHSSDDAALGRRMARNLPIILERESGLTHVIDPLAGSHAVETLTAELTALTWQALADMGDTDAWLTSLSEGRWQAELAETQAQRVASISQETQVMVGVNRYLAHTDCAPADADADPKNGLNETPNETPNTVSSTQLHADSIDNSERDLRDTAKADAASRAISRTNVDASESHPASTPCVQPVRDADAFETSQSTSCGDAA